MPPVIIALVACVTAILSRVPGNFIAAIGCGAEPFDRMNLHVRSRYRASLFLFPHGDVRSSVLHRLSNVKLDFPLSNGLDFDYAGLRWTMVDCRGPSWTCRSV